MCSDNPPRASGYVIVSGDEVVGLVHKRRSGRELAPPFRGHALLLQLLWHFSLGRRRLRRQAGDKQQLESLAPSCEGMFTLSVVASPYTEVHTLRFPVSCTRQAQWWCVIESDDDERCLSRQTEKSLLADDLAWLIRWRLCVH